MRHLRERSALLWLPGLLLLSGCGGPEANCDSAETRNSVIKAISSDSHNALVDYAVKNSNVGEATAKSATTEAAKSETREKASQAASYRLDDQIVTNSKSKDKRSATCSGTLYVTIGDTTAQKKVDFKVEQTPDGIASVTVSPFKF